MIRYIIRYAWKREPVLYLFICLNVVFLVTLTVSNLYMPKLFIEELTGEQSIRRLIIISAVFFIVTGGFSYASSIVKGKSLSVMQKLRAFLERDLNLKMLTMEYEKFDSPENEDKLYKAQSATSSYTTGFQSIYNQMFEITSSAASIVFIAGAMAILNPVLLMFIALNLAVLLFSAYQSNRYIAKKSLENAHLNRREWYLSDVVYNFDYGKDIRVYGLADWLLGKYRGVSKQRAAVESDKNKRLFKHNVVDLTFALLREGLVYFFLIAQCLGGKMSIADFSFYFFSVAAFTTLSNSLVNSATHTVSQFQYVGAYLEYMGIDAEDGKASDQVEPSDAYRIEFENVWFQYPGSEDYVYKDFSFRLEPNEKLAVLGLNGAGKTTLVKLLLRLYRPVKGRILLNGRDINTLDYASYIRLFATVFQDSVLYAATLKENVYMAHEGAEDKALEAIKLAGFGEKLGAYEKGLDTELTKFIKSDGVDVSGGEKQKITLARALYKNAPFLILDEPTSSLDAIAEYDLYKNLAEISENKTVLFISHRLASTRFCDRIILIEDGGIKEIGTHDELLEKQGRYFEMYTMQVKYYREGEANGHE